MKGQNNGTMQEEFQHVLKGVKLDHQNFVDSADEFGIRYQALMRHYAAPEPSVDSLRKRAAAVEAAWLEFRASCVALTLLKDE